MYEEAINFIKKIKMMGYEAYIIGGYPRDKYCGINNCDIDICTNMKPEMLKEKFNVLKDNGYGSLIIDNFEITTYRKDIYTDTRYPIIQYVDTLIEDINRRDFIINTLCIDSEGKYVDLLGAISDIENKIIRSVGNADTKFKEDPIRIIRAIRFNIDLKFELNSDIIDSIKRNKELLNNISKTKIEKEINKIKNKERIHILYDYIGDVYERKNN